MGRPRKHNNDLPRCVFYKHGAYYFVKDKKWHWLSADRGRAIELAAERSVTHQPTPADPADVLRAHLHKKFAMLKARPSTRTGRLKQVSLTADYVLSLAESNGWQCAVTGLPFTLEVVNGRRPYAPSIDRIDNALDYIPGNVRVVCTAANLAMNVWGEQVLLRMMRGIVSRRGRVLNTVQKFGGPTPEEPHEQGVLG